MDYQDVQQQIAVSAGKRNPQNPGFPEASISRLRPKLPASRWFFLGISEIGPEKARLFPFQHLWGRQCAINFANIHAIQHSESLEIESSSYEIKGVRIYFASDAQPLEISASSEEIALFYSDMASGSVAAQLAGWTIEKARVVLAIASSEFQEYLDLECHH